MDRAVAARMENSVKSPFNFRSNQKPFLAPLGTQSRFPRPSREMLDKLPPAAAPIAVTVLGGAALILLLGTFLSREASVGPADQTAATAQEEVLTQEVAVAAEPAMADEPSAAPEVSQEIVEPGVAASDAALQAPENLAAIPPLGEPALEPDQNRTSSILSAAPHAGAFEPAVPVAETDDEIAALEAIQRREVEEDIGPPSEEQTASIGQPASGPRAQATTTRYVNMRSGPSDDADIIVVVPALVEVEAETGCNWCAVAYEGRSGYIYKTFLSYD